MQYYTNLLQLYKAVVFPPTVSSTMPPHISRTVTIANAIGGFSPYVHINGATEIPHRPPPIGKNSSDSWDLVDVMVTVSYKSIRRKTRVMYTLIMVFYRLSCFDAFFPLPNDFYKVSNQSANTKNMFERDKLNDDVENTGDDPF